MSRKGIAYSVVVDAIEAVLKEGRDVTCRNVQAQLRQNPANGTPSNNTVVAHIHQWEVLRAKAAELALAALSSDIQWALLGEMANREQIVRKSLQGQIEAAEKGFRDSLTQLSDATEQVERLTAELTAIKEAATLHAKSLENKLAHASGQVEALEKRCSELNAAVQESRDEATRRQQESQQAERTTAKAEAKLTELQGQADALRGELAAAKSDVAVGAERTAGVEAARAALQDQLRSATKRANRLEQENKDLLARLQAQGREVAEAIERAAIAETACGHKGKSAGGTGRQDKKTNGGSNGAEKVVSAAPE